MPCSTGGSPGPARGRSASARPILRRVVIGVGTRLGPYEVTAPLGAGGMGEVYRARDVRLGREVAVKLLPAASWADGERRRRFEQEARAVSALNHPNVLTLYDVGEADGVLYLVTELLAGETLRGRLRGAGLPFETALLFGLQVARGLAAAHERGIVHRDLKPENLFVTEDGTVKILDFGLAKLSEPAALPPPADAPPSDAPPGDVVPTDAVPTGAGAVLGTAGYMAPEQARGLPSDHRADLFAFGCLLYEMLAGRPAFAGTSAAERTSALLRDEPVLPLDLPPTVEHLLRHCLAKDPKQRWQSARDVALELESARATLGVERATVRSGPGGALDSLVVLPFENRTGDAASEYLAEGIAESLLSDLSRAGGLRVLGRATAFRFRGAGDPEAAARQLGVAAALSGRVLEVAGRLVVRAELTRADDGAHLWGAQYDHPPGDVLALQEQVSAEIAEALASRLAGEGRRRARRPTASTAAYDLYLKGRYFLFKRTVPACRQAMEYFDAAVATDPGYALAWSGLADALILLERYGGAPPHAVMDRCRAAAERAIAADEGLAEGHCSRGGVCYYFEWDWERGEREFRRAIELDPSYATAHHWYGWCLGELGGRADESIAELERALAIDPLSLIVQTNYGTVLYFARRWAEAERALREALALEPGFAVAHQWLGRTLGAAGGWAEAVAEHRRAWELLGEDPESLASVAHACARAGDVEEARRLQAELSALAARRWVSPYWFALIEVGLGRHDEALELLARAVEERMDWVIALGVEPSCDPLRERPRFTELLRRVGLPAVDAR